MTPGLDVTRDPKKNEPARSTPHGPHGDQIDEASGGADSSPYDNLSSEERHDVQAELRRRGKSEQDDLSPTP